MFAPGEARNYLTNLLYTAGLDALRVEVLRLLRTHHGCVTDAARAACCSRPFFWHMIRRARLQEAPIAIRRALRHRVGDERPLHKQGAPDGAARKYLQVS